MREDQYATQKMRVHDIHNGHLRLGGDSPRIEGRNCVRRPGVGVHVGQCRCEGFDFVSFNGWSLANLWREIGTPKQHSTENTPQVYKPRPLTYTHTYAQRETLRRTLPCTHAHDITIDTHRPPRLAWRHYHSQFMPLLKKGNYYHNS